MLVTARRRRPHLRGGDLGRAKARGPISPGLRRYAGPGSPAGRKISSSPGASYRSRSRPRPGGRSAAPLRPWSCLPESTVGRQGGIIRRTDRGVAKRRLRKARLLFARRSSSRRARKPGMTSTQHIQFVSGTRLTATQNFDDRWVDVGFLDHARRPGQRRRDIAEQRSHLLGQAGRDLDEGAAIPVAQCQCKRHYRVERTASPRSGKNEREPMRQRSATARFEYLDLSAEPAPAAN